MKKRILSALLVLCMVFSLGTVSVLAVEPAATEAGDTSTGGEVETKAVILQRNGEVVQTFDWPGQAIKQAQDGDVIIITEDLNVENISSNSTELGVYSITKDITIIGQKPDGGAPTLTFSGSERKDDNSPKINQVFDIKDEAKVTIGNIIIDNKYDHNNTSNNYPIGARNGIQAYGDGTKVTLKNVTVKNSYGYGVIASSGGEVDATDLVATGNGWGGVNVDAKNNLGAKLTLNGENTNLKGDAAGENGSNASVVIESDAGLKTTTTINAGQYDVVATHSGTDGSEQASAGDDMLIITGGSYESVASYGTGTDTFSITGGIIQSIKKANISSSFSVKNATVTKVLDTNDDEIKLDDENAASNLTSTGIVFESVTLGSGTSTPFSNVVAVVDDKSYTDFSAALTAANSAAEAVTIELKQDVELTDGITISKNVTIEGNGNKIDIKLDAASETGVTISAGGTLTLDNLDLDVNGTRNNNNDGFHINGDLTLKNDSKVGVYKVRTAFVFNTDDKKPVQIEGSTVTVNNTTGAFSNGGNWTVKNGSTIDIDYCGTYGMSVNSLVVENGATVNIKNTGYGAIYAFESISIDGSVKIESCGKDLPYHSTGGYGDCTAPIQICENAKNHSAPKGTIVIGKNGKVSITNCSTTGSDSKEINYIYVVTNTTFENEGGSLTGSVVSEKADSGKYVVTYTSGPNTLMSENGGVGYTLKSPQDITQWKDSAGNRYTAGQNYNITADIELSPYEEPEAETYRITINSPTGGTVTTTPGTSAAEGVTVTVNAKASTGYVADTITVATADGTVTANKASDASWTFTMPGEEVTITVTFKQSATTQPGGDTQVAAPALADLRPSTGYFDRYFSSGVYSYNYTLNYWTDRVTLNATAASNCSIDGSTAVTVVLQPGETRQVPFTVRNSAGTTVTYYVNVSRNSAPYAYLTDLDFSAGELNTDFSSYTTSYTLTIPAATESVTLDPTVVSGGTLDVTGYDERDGGEYIVEVDAGKTQTINFKVTRSGETVTYSVTVVRKAVDRVTIADTLNGEITVSNIDAKEGDRVYIYIDPDTGYELDKLTVTDEDDKAVTVTSVDDDTRRFTMPKDNVVVTATFKRVISSVPFTDVGNASWYYDAVLYVYANGLMDGVSNTTFSPNSTMTRSMIWAVLGRIDGETNITGSSWESRARTWAVSSGVSDGTSGAQSVTREQLVTMLWRFAGEPNTTRSLSGWADRYSVSDWAEEAMAWAVSEGVITGATATTLNPKGNATRAECATMLMRFVENL